MEKEMQKLLPMPPLSTKECYPYEPLYNLPPTFKEGARKVVLVRDLFLYDGRPSWKAGTKGVVIPIQRSGLAELFENVKTFFGNYPEWTRHHGYYPYRLDKTYDFFPYYTNKKGMVCLSIYHTHIGFTDFQYVSNERKKTINNHCPLGKRD